MYMHKQLTQVSTHAHEGMCVCTCDYEYVCIHTGVHTQTVGLCIELLSS